MSISRYVFFADDELVIETNCTTVPVGLSAKFVGDLVEYVNAWKKSVDLELETWIARQFGVPSFLVRVDCTVNGDERPFVFEVEDSPAGAHMTCQISRQFAQNLRRLQENWPVFKAFVSSKKRFSDVVKWLGPADEKYLGGKGLLWNVIRPEEAEEYRELIARSVTPVEREGDKRPLAKICPHTRVARGFDDLKDLLADPLVIKPVQGTRARNILVWKGRLSHSSRDMINSPDKLAERMRKEEEWIVQPFVPPTSLPDRVVKVLGEKYARHWTTFRVFFGYDVRTDRYVPLGGVWNALKRVDYAIVHGRSSALFGPALLPS